MAECFNSFDDSDSWPGGFTHGVAYTSERVLRDKKKSQDLRTIVAHKKGKIVGHCNITAGELDEEAVYVGLLGVNPSYQGEGFGKALLVEAAETAARLGKRRIDLHTWGGNLKALPLYKRTGYNWVPRTRVLMESHIPGILGCEVFENFFERHNWYDSYQRTIRQEIDDIKEGAFGIFRYVFEAENDRLEVTVDREAKGISGFSLTLGGKTLSVDIRPREHVGYIGVGSVPYQIEIRNQWGSSLSFSADHTDYGGLDNRLDTPPPDAIENNSEIHLEGAYSVTSDATHLDRELTPDEKVKTQVRWHVMIDGKCIDLFNGLVPQEAVSLIPSPRYPFLAPQESRQIGLGLQNNTLKQLTGRLSISSEENQREDYEFSLGVGATDERVITLGPVDGKQLLNLPVNIYINDNGEEILASRKVLNIPVIGIGGAYAYKSHDDMYILENRQLRYAISSKSPMGGMGLTNKHLSLEIGMWSALLPDVGYPFSAGGSEWERKRFDVSLGNDENKADIIIQADSEDRPGLHLKTTYRLRADSEYIEIITELTNSGRDSLENLGVMLRGWAELECNDMYIPVRGDIYRLASPEWNGMKQLPRNPSEYHESWFALKWADGHSQLGFIWDAEAIAELQPRRTWGLTRFEYKFPNLSPGESHRCSVLKLVLSEGSWKSVRDLWARLTGTTIDRASPIEPRSDLEVGLAPSGRSEINQGSPVFLDRLASNEMNLMVKVLHEEPIDVDIFLRAPNGVLINEKDELHVPDKSVSIEQPLIVPLTMRVTDESWLQRDGTIELRFPNRVARLPLTVVAFDSQLEVVREQTVIEDVELRTVRAGQYELSASPDYCGNLVRYRHSTEVGMLYDTFPEVKPFIWWDSHYSGLTPVIAGYNVWDWESSIPKEAWSISDLAIGPWRGYELESVLQHCPRMCGMTFRFRYLLLSGTALVHIKVTAENTSRITRQFVLGVRGATAPLQAPFRSIRIPLPTGPTTVEMTENEVSVTAVPEEGWAAVINPDGCVLGIVTTCKGQESLQIYNANGQTQFIGFKGRRTLLPRESTSLSGYLFMSSDPKSVERLKFLPKDVE
ncbi:GNAT family N-acetyltransferase [Candidatus Thorarchaeota archaeon]|nr:MAG: GNAT family N-acetyltransferase [Candidatus Thorarchaeota archaeon]